MSDDASERIRKEALSRIVPPKSTKDADLSNEEIVNVYTKMRNDNDPTNWMLLGYRESQNELQLYGSGEGGLEEMKSNLVEEPLFGYFSHVYGDTNRKKFIFLSWLPESVGGMKKSRVMGHKAAVDAFFKYFHITISAFQQSDLSQSVIEGRLKAAGGADYGVGTGGGTRGEQNFGGIKDQAKNLYLEKEKETNVQIVYEKGPLTTTPCDLSGRAMVAPPSEAKKNINLTGNLDSGKIKN